jgi:hypothetical protein
LRDFDPNRGWQILCVGGPLDGVHVRSWCMDRTKVIAEPERHADQIPHRMTVLMQYGKESTECCVDPTGHYQTEATGKMSTYKGVKVPSRRYVWTET